MRRNQEPTFEETRDVLTAIRQDAEDLHGLAGVLEKAEQLGLRPKSRPGIVRRPRRSDEDAAVAFRADIRD